MSNKSLIIGKNSFLANEFITKLEPDSFRALSHSEALASSVFDEIDCVINFAYNPKLSKIAYEESYDIDYALRKKIIDSKIHYVMISTRKVYSENYRWNSIETDHTRPLDYYGRNKRETEKNLLSLGEQNMTILRVGNVIGEELNAQRVRMGSYLINGLKTAGAHFIRAVS
jgi:dTDP-4-dehydrorhamnose reductase